MDQFEQENMRWALSYKKWVISYKKVKYFSRWAPRSQPAKVLPSFFRIITRHCIMCPCIKCRTCLYVAFAASVYNIHGYCWYRQAPYMYKPFSPIKVKYFWCRGYAPDQNTDMKQVIITKCFKGPARLCRFCLFSVLLPITFLCVPLYMRWSWWWQWPFPWRWRWRWPGSFPWGPMCSPSRPPTWSFLTTSTGWASFDWLFSTTVCFQVSPQITSVVHIW